MPMGLPQTHLIAFCSDLGILPNHGAAMLSMLLGTGFLCRQLWGFFSDRAEGLATLVVCSAIQVSALSAFLLTQDEIGLFTVSTLFGLGFSGLVPAYVLVLRQFYPVREAGWRIPALLLASGSGMAIGGWIGGVFYDMFGYYGQAFLAAIIANLLNFAIVATLFVLLPSRADLSHVRGRARDSALPQALTAGIDAGAAQSSRAAQLRVL
jgi:predicted MFS family arabinose efflux permease